METIIIKTEEDEIAKIKTFLNEFQVSFTIAQKEEEPYDPAFVKMVLERKKSAGYGNTIRYTEELKNELFG